MRRFDHRPHLNESLRITCTDCHASATASKSSADVLVPDIDRCRSCHGEESARDEGLAACTTCHYYHAASSRFGAGWTAKTITASLTPSAARPTPAPAEPRSGGSFVRIMSIFTLFLLAVAAFVALFWVWRRFERSETADTSLALHGQGEGTPPAPPRSPAPAAPRAPAPPPPPPAAPAPPPAAPLHPQSPPPEPTVAINLRPPEPEAPAGGTVVIEWVGVLVGITGPYKGKKIPIDPAGFYIGRDKELSTIVVDDPRISRRHVWIGVKNGKVVAVEQGSTNGTFLNNVGSAPIAEVELKAGDVLILADQAASFRFEP